MSMRNSNDTIWKRASDLRICGTAPYPLRHRGPLFRVGMKANLPHNKQNTCPAHFYITSKQYPHVHSYKVFAA